MATNDDFPQDALGELIARHPALFRGNTPYASHMPVGWLSLADALCADLEMILGDRCSEFDVSQVKEKWASLRFYWAVRGAETPLHADIGGVRPEASQPSSEPDEPGFRRRVVETHFGLRLTLSPDTPLANAIVERIERAEDASTATCEWCGQPGRLWVAGHGGPGYHYTACDAHKGNGALTKDQWLARITARRAQVGVDDDMAYAVLQVASGDTERARVWYDEPLPAFVGKTPRQLLSEGRKGDLLTYLAALLAGPAG